MTRACRWPEESRGSGPARNFAWDHAVASGSERHWIIDDNINGFARMFKSRRIPVADGTMFACIEDFISRYTNIAMAGPNYHMFATTGLKVAPFPFIFPEYTPVLLYSHSKRYSSPGALPIQREDLDLSLRVLKAGWCTIQFNAFLQNKTATQTMRGGNTDAFYAAEGTLPKSRMIVQLHPDAVKLTWKFALPGITKRITRSVSAQQTDPSARISRY